MIKVYVCGAYSDDNVISVLKNIGRGEKEAAKLFMLGYAVFCPWFDKDFILKFPEHDFKVEDFLNYSMEWLKVSDVVYVVPNMIGLKSWLRSQGTLAEIKKANELGIPVIFSMKELNRRFPVKENIDTTEIFGL